MIWGKGIIGGKNLWKFGPQLLLAGRFTIVPQVRSRFCNVSPPLLKFDD